MQPSMQSGSSKRFTRKKHKFIAGLLSALFPGLGHLYLGVYLKGLTFIFLLFLDLSALLYFSTIGIQINVPLLILLGLLIPVLYFINIYEVLQLADQIVMRKRRPQELSDEDDRTLAVVRPNIRFLAWERGISFGILLIFGGTLMVLFIQRPRWLQQYIALYGTTGTAVVLILIGGILLVREILLSLSFWKKQKNKRMALPYKIRIGRYTATLFIMVTGILLLLDQIYQTEYMFELLRYWPFILVIWGIEFITSFILHQQLRPSSKRKYKWRFKPDFKGIIFSVTLIACIFVVTQQDHYTHLWNRVSLNLSSASMDYSEAKDNRIVKDTISVPVEMSTASVLIENVNGDIRVNRDDVDEIQINTIVWVDQVEEVEAEAVAEASEIKVNEGKTIHIATSPQGYGSESKRQPRLNMTITIPDDRRFDLEVRTSNGAIYMDRPQAINNINVESGNGKIYIHSAIGDIRAKTLNGNISVANVTGSASLDTNRGDLRAEDVSKEIRLSTQVGHIQTSGIAGDIEAKTRNGNINVIDPVNNLNLETLNGAVKVTSSMVGGNWNIYSAVGDINLSLPEDGDYTLEGSSTYGNLNSELPFTVKNREIQGTVGEGEYKITIEGNSDLIINQIQMTEDIPEQQTTPRDEL
ncbi:DUF4097 family beta strand repeat-containing protein [Paenibacillus gallinarum]|uniref:DUF4097 family beta strand repeat protein n=1 Tax=Paenibacillus gallinarum TaxID=2762232 RepID=A0ABR8T4M3_9BACL|nr:DUF4097 family beta strand repeat-containing protein [Paenibacillus gallinarum]MBD7970719.1 DUF4097 family beta strand repeat protein [Paenibacillus gallinarum]